jgi:hypothetical protein
VNYTQLINTRATAGSIKSWINRDTTDPDTVLLDAQNLIYTTLRHWRMKSEATGTLTIDQPYLTLPTDFIDCKDLWIVGAERVRMKRGDERSVIDLYEYDGSNNRVSNKPYHFYITGTRANLDQPPDQAYPYLLPYYAKPADLGSGNLTNFLTDFHPRFLRTACMLVATEFEKEVGQGQFDRSYWQQQFDKQLIDIQAASNVVDGARDLGAEYG